MDGLLIALFFFFGTAIGSFLNVVADRLPAGKSVVSPPSSCPVCQRRLSAGDMVPIFSYLRLKGRCRYCGVTIPLRLLCVELGTGILFAFLYWHYGLGWDLAVVAFYCCLFVALLVIDLERGILPNKIIYPGVVVALLLSLVVGPGIKSAAIGGGVGFAFLLIPALIWAAMGKEGMGWGDIKMAGLIGVVTGFPLVFVAMFLAVFGGGLIAGVLLLSKLKNRQDTIPFGPSLALATMATLFWGNNLLGWYLGFS